MQMTSAITKMISKGSSMLRDQERVRQQEVEKELSERFAKWTAMIDEAKALVPIEVRDALVVDQEKTRDLPPGGLGSIDWFLCIEGLAPIQVRFTRGAKEIIYETPAIVHTEHGLEFKFYIPSHIRHTCENTQVMQRRDLSLTLARAQELYQLKEKQEKILKSKEQYVDEE